MAVMITDSSKRTKIDSLEEQVLLHSPSSDVSSPVNSISPATSGTSDHVPSSMCSSNQSDLESLDLKADDLEAEIFILINGGFREESPLTELESDTDEMESKPSPDSSRRKQSPAKKPSAAEIEEFFSVAEKSEQKRFAEKYNYDIVKDMPLEGRYQWILLKP
ncbi:hypothetical protein LguiB_022143 [Lonicera macranthoides]